MFNLLKEFYNFAGEQKKNLTVSLVYAILLSVFKALNIMAIAVVLRDFINKNVSMQSAWQAVAIMVVSIAGQAIFKGLSVMRQTNAGYKMCANKRIEISERLKYLPMGYFNKNNLGYITSITTNSLESLADVSTRIMQVYIEGLIVSVMICLSMLIFDYRIGLITLTGFFACLFVNSYMQKSSDKISPKKIAVDEKIVDVIIEYVQGISTFRSFNVVGKANKKVKDAINNTEKVNFGLEKVFIPFFGYQYLVTKIFSILIILSALWFYTSGTLSLFNCIMVSIASFIVYADLELAFNFSALVKLAILNMRKVNTIFDAPTIETAGDSTKVKNHKLEVNNISFSYNDKKIIDNVSLKIPEGTTTAFVGPSGSGKTTICHLLARFWDVDAGEIKLDGKNIKDYEYDNLLANFSMVFQDVYLFNDTVANNIKFGKSSATMSDIEAAAKKACCYDFIMSLPDKFNTVIGEGGASISGGEKQRISIARAILKDAPIIIFDEATANVDPENEDQLQRAIQELTKSKTVIIIAHRLKTVRNAKQIFVINEGKISEYGNHDQLMQKTGQYSKFVNMRKLATGWKLGRKLAS